MWDNCFNNNKYAPLCNKENMKKTIIILATIVCLVVLATCFAGCTISLENANYVTTNHNQLDSFDNIYIDTDIANVIIEKTDGPCKVTCFETDKLYHKVKVEDETLKIESITKNHVNYTGIVRPLSVTVYLPEKKYANLEIESDTGNVSVSKDLTFKDIDISCDTGNISMDTIKCSTLSAESDTGNVNLSDTVASATINVNVDTGDIVLSDCDAPVINLETELGDVRGSLLTGKTFVVKSELGDIDVPDNDPTGGVCTINTDLGDIDITIA